MRQGQGCPCITWVGGSGRFIDRQRFVVRSLLVEGARQGDLRIDIARRGINGGAQLFDGILTPA